MIKEINFIKDYLTINTGTMEAENIEKDLSFFVSRIKTGEYKNTDIMSRQSFDTMRRTYEFFNYLIGYHQHSCEWAKILELIPIEKLNSICDFCSGHSPKVQWALRKLKYKNKHFIVDQDELSISQMRTLLNILEVGYETTFIQDDLFSLKGKYDLITANHIFDDIVLNDFCIKSQKPLRSLYASEQLFCESVDSIQKTYNQQIYANKLVILINSCLNNSGYIIMTHYSGITETALQLDSWTNWAYKIMLLTYDGLKKMGYKNTYDELPNKDIQNDDLEKRLFILQKPE